jgi:very-short-patch-repair endonuclease
MKEILLERAINMRINPTIAEKKFKEKLEKQNIKFKDQWVIGMYIVDFLVGNTIYELDGASHIGREEYDNNRTKYLNSLGYKVIRILNQNVDSYIIKKSIQKSRSKKKILSKISSGTKAYKKLNWGSQRKILQRERLYGK